MAEAFAAIVDVGDALQHIAGRLRGCVEPPGPDEVNGGIEPGADGIAMLRGYSASARSTACSFVLRRTKSLAHDAAVADVPRPHGINAAQNATR
jgi:hypothetical protein